MGECSTTIDASSVHYLGIPAGVSRVMEPLTAPATLDGHTCSVVSSKGSCMLFTFQL